MIFRDKWMDDGKKNLTDLYQHAKQRLPVLSPKRGQLISWGEQATAGIYSNFRTVTKVHTEVL